MVIDLAPELLEILACPNCHGGLAVDHDQDELVCVATDCGLAYPVRSGIPVLLIDEARRPVLAEADDLPPVPRVDPNTQPPTASSAPPSAPPSASPVVPPGA